MTQAETLITEHLDLWTNAVKPKKAAGRGRGKGSSSKRELYGLKKLRELILELAVRGQLVPQDPNDEPASVLLERIATEKAYLIAEKKIKKQKALPPITDDEKPFNLPQGWEWTRLSELSEINPRNVADDDLEVSFIPMPMVLTAYDGKHEQEVKSWREIKKGYTHFADGDIAVAKITPCFENSKAAIFRQLKNGLGAGTTELHVARPFDDALSKKYILLYLKSPMFLRVGESKMTGTAGQKRLPKDFFAGNSLPLPPLAEQHRIVAKVDELMQLCDQLEQTTETNLDAHQTLVENLLAALVRPSPQPLSLRGRGAKDSGTSEFPLALRERGLGGEGDAWQRIATHFDTLFTTEHSIDQLKQTILQLAVMGKLVPQDPSDEPASVLLEKIAAEKAQLIAEKKIKKQKALPPIGEDEKPFALPEGWEWCRLLGFSVVGTGATPSRDKIEYYQPAKHFWVTSGETGEDFVTSTNEKVSDKAVSETNVSLYPAGTLIVAMYGQGKTRGQITELLIEAGTNQACAAIQLVHSSEIHRRYVKLFFKKAYEELRAHAAGGAQPNLNVGKISATVIPIPPLVEQQRIVAKVDELMALCDQLKTRLNTAQQTQWQLADAVARVNTTP